MRFVFLTLFIVFALPAKAVLLTGTVLDQSGTPIAKAIVTIEGTNLRVVTDTEGRYRFANIPPRPLKILVSSPDHVHHNCSLEHIDENHVEDFVLMPTHMANMVVSADVLENSVLDSVLPTTILSGDRLQREQAPTMGETLKNTTGVHSSYFGPVAASPIIRGSDGPRVKIVQNGLDSSDASRVGQDHAVAIDAATASHIEVLRGPATLQFGDGAIGGVVNVVDSRIPKHPPTKRIQGTMELRTDSASNERFGKVDLNGGSGSWAYHFGSFSRKTDDIDIPGFAEREPEEDAEPGTLPNSSTDTQSYTAGISWSGTKGLLGVSAQKMDNLFGLPGHSHHDEHAQKDERGLGEPEDEELVFSDMDMERFQLHGEWFTPFRGIQKLSLDSGFTDYSHFEIENAAIGTTFSSKTFENRASLNHETIKGWDGVLGFHLTKNDYAAIGEEAFTPPTRTESFAIYVAEDRSFQDFRLEIGARYNHSEITPNGIARVDLGHEEDHHDKSAGDDDHGDDHEVPSFELSRQTFQSFSMSTGFNWNYAQGNSLALVLTRAERSPSTPELFSAGAHLATSTYELGAVFDLDADGEVLFLPDRVSTEKSTGLDLTWRKFDGNWGYSISAFYNRVNDYFYQQNTGLVVADSHDDHGSPEKSGDDHDDEEEGLPVLLFRQDDARIYGLEFEVTTRFNPYWTARLFGDSVRTQLDEAQDGSRNLPRLPPMRLGTVIDFKTPMWSADLGATWYDDQTRVAAFETTTEGYLLVNAGLSYRHRFQKLGLVGFLRGRNLADEEARVHTSFIKDLAPLPGRAILAGFRLEF